jgi:hypothetical protein
MQSPSSISELKSGRDRDQIGTLLSLINTATRDAILEYEKYGHGIPNPNAVESHPLDEVPDALGLKKAIRVLEGACELLCSTLAQPMHTIINASVLYNLALFST